MLSSYKFREVSFRRHDPQGKLKEHLNQVVFLWSYSHEDLLPGEISQSQVLVKSQIPTLDQMYDVDKEAKKKKAIEESNKVASEKKNLIRIEDGEESSSSSSIFMYSIDFDQESSEVPSCRSPTLIGVQIPEIHEEVHSSPPTEKNPFERHSIIQEEEDPSSYNIEEIFEAFTFNLFKKEVRQKIVHNEKQNDGTLKEIQEDEVLFEKIDEDLVTVETTSTTLSQATTHNVTVFNENIS